jgi:ABC-type polysaccharide/polyol phosphate export permease
MSPPEDVLKIILGWLMLAWFGGSLALFIGTLSARTEIVDRIWHPMAYFLFPLSGALFMVDWLPKGIREFMLLFPMVHGVEILREGYFGSKVHAHYDIAYMALCSLGLTLIGLSQERVISRQVTPE